MNKAIGEIDAIDDGFSSDEEIRHQQIIVEEPKIQQVKPQHKEQVKFKIPPPEEIKAKSYSLNPDLATGWTPKNDLPVPVPLLFEHKRLDCMLNRIADKNNSNSKLQIVYLGPRFENTFYSWHEQPFSFPYSHIKGPTNMKFTNRLFFGQNPQINDSVIFDSFFESGNLDCAIRVGEKQYDLYIRVDSNTRGHLQWFFFKAKNLEKLQQYRFNICNFQKNKSLYNRGMKPYVFSSKKYQKEKVSWQQAGTSIKYEQKLGKSAKVLNLQNSTSYKLSFDYYTEYDDDEVQFAYCIPYTYSQFMSFLKKLEKQCEGNKFFSRTKLCTSLGGLEVPLIIINENDNSESSDFSEIPKKCIVISGRAHPGESNGSHMMQGFLQFLCGNSDSAKSLRRYYIFKIVPMLNPDGVAIGNYRTGISGKDFNREYRNPEKTIFPEVFAFKKLVIENKAKHGDNLLMFLDFHGHSIKKNVFMYGPEFPIIQKNYYECRVFPKILSNVTNMFRYYSCTFRISEFKETTARAVLLRKLMIPFSFTIEASNGSYYDQEKLKDVPFTKQTWQKMGLKIGEALSTYGVLAIQAERNRLQKKKQRFKKRQGKRSISRGRSLNPIQQNTISQRIHDHDNEKMAKMYDEIKKVQNQRGQELNEEDNLSQGSSDGEGQKDDLTKDKINFLYKIIKNKKLNGSQKFRKRMEEESKNFKTNQFEESQTAKDTMEKIEEQPTKEYSSELTDLIFRPNPNTRGYLLRNNKMNHTTYLNEQKNSKVTAKIINFSFLGGHQLSPRKNLSRNNEPTEITPAIKRNSDADESIKNRKVLDLSFRETQGAFRSGQKFVIMDPKSSTFYKPSPRKMINKLDQYKYRRLFIDEYRI